MTFGSKTNEKTKARIYFFPFHFPIKRMALFSFMALLQFAHKMRLRSWAKAARGDEWQSSPRTFCSSEDLLQVSPCPARQMKLTARYKYCQVKVRDATSFQARVQAVQAFRPLRPRDECVSVGPRGNYTSPDYLGGAVNSGSVEGPALFVFATATPEKCW